MNEGELERVRERLVALTRDLMLAPSIPSRPEDVRRCYDQVKNHLEAVAGTVVREFEKEGFPSLVAAPEGCEEPVVLMCAHLDVISHPDLAAYRSQVREGRIWGPGSGDMKGALAILLEIYRAIQRRKPGAPVGVAVTSDEETGGAFGMGFLFGEAGIRCGLALIPDGGSLDEVTVEEKGILHLRVSCRGKAGHAARPWLAENAVERLMDGLARVRGFFGDFAEEGMAEENWRPTCAVTLIGTNNQTVNRIPSLAEATLDIRFPGPHSVDSVLAEVRRALGEGIASEVVISAEATRLAPDALFLEVAEEVLGRPVKLIRDDGGSDARFVAAHGIPVIMSRPLVGNLHARDEWIDIDSMLRFYRIYEEYLARKLELLGAGA